MQFLYNQLAGEEKIILKNEDFKHIIKARRSRLGDEIVLRNLKENVKFFYILEEIYKNYAIICLRKKEIDNNLPEKGLTLGWAVIDQKNVEKTLPILNEMGVFCIAFVYTDFSQRHFKPNLQRLERICINSSEQCGRENLMKFEIYEDMESFFKTYPHTYVLDFNSNEFKKSEQSITSVFIGAEGGFSDKEMIFFEKNQISKISFKTTKILRSESAAVGAVAKILL